MDFSTIALLHGREPLYERAAGLPSPQLQQLYVALNCMNDALTQPRYDRVMALRAGFSHWSADAEKKVTGHVFPL